MSKAKIKPLGNKILIRKDKKAEKSDGGVLIPEKIRGEEEMYHLGTVEAVGPGKVNDNGKRDTISCRAGDRIIYKNTVVDRFSRMAGIEEAGEYVLVFMSDILAVIDGKELKPLGNKILIQPDERAEKSDGGVIISAAILIQEEMYHYGHVVAKGQGALDEKGNMAPIYCEKGDYVVYRNTIVDRFDKQPGLGEFEDYVLVDSKFILGVVG